jgi:D-proline reductase (dithiol) PrdB
MATDDVLRANAITEAFDFGSTPATVAPPIGEARVAIVTTAGLHSTSGGMWTEGQGFVAFDSDTRDLTLAHASSNFDRSGLLADLNVVYPADRLQEMAADGVIGSVASRHLSFMGAQPDHVLETLRLDTAPQAAAQLRADGVDVALLTPV